MDAVPGKVNTFYFRADQLGTYDGDSAQLSGQGYAAMRTQVEVVSPADYRAFIARQRDDIQAAQDIVVKQATHPPGSTPKQNETAAQAQPKPTNEPTPASDAGAQVLRRQRMRRLPHPGRRGIHRRGRSQPRQVAGPRRPCRRRRGR